MHTNGTQVECTHAHTHTHTHRHTHTHTHTHIHTHTYTHMLRCMTTFISSFYGTVPSTNVPEKLEGEHSNNSGMCMIVSMPLCVGVCMYDLAISII